MLPLGITAPKEGRLGEGVSLSTPSVHALEVSERGHERQIDRRFSLRVVRVNDGDALSAPIGTLHLGRGLANL